MDALSAFYLLGPALCSAFIVVAGFVAVYRIVLDLRKRMKAR